MMETYFGQRQMIPFERLWPEKLNTSLTHLSAESSAEYTESGQRAVCTAGQNAKLETAKNNTQQLARLPHAQSQTLRQGRILRKSWLLGLSEGGLRGRGFKVRDR